MKCDKYLNLRVDGAAAYNIEQQYSTCPGSAAGQRLSSGEWSRPAL